MSKHKFLLTVAVAVAAATLGSYRTAYTAGGSMNGAAGQMPAYYDGELFTVNYGVAVNATPTDSAWAVSGNISITNPAGNPSVTINTVTDTLSTDSSATVPSPVSRGKLRGRRPLSREREQTTCSTRTARRWRCRNWRPITGGRWERDLAEVAVGSGTVEGQAGR